MTNYQPSRFESQNPQFTMRTIDRDKDKIFENFKSQTIELRKENTSLKTTVQRYRKIINENLNINVTNPIDRKDSLS